MPAQKIFAAAALAGALVLSSVPASAADRSAEVRYVDLDLTSQADVALLKQRVALAVKHVCGNANIRNLREVEDMKRCCAAASTRRHNDVELALDNDRNGTRLARNAGMTLSQSPNRPVLRAGLQYVRESCRDK